MQSESHAPKRTLPYVITIITLIALAGFFAGFSLNLQNQISDLASKVSLLNAETTSLQTVIQNMQNRVIDLHNRIPDGNVRPVQLPVAGEGKLSNGLDFSDLYEKVKVSVVQIRAGGASGSGWVYDDQNHIVTNWHVIRGTDNVEVVLHEGTTIKAKVSGYDQYSDLAVISATPTQGVNLKPLPMGNSLKVRVGERVIAVGAPFGLTGSITQGIVSQGGRLLQAPGTPYSIPNVIQMDVPINPGNSGGPLLNLNGEVIGVTSAGVTRGGNFEGVGLALPVNSVKRVIPSLLLTGTYKHPYLGITGTDVTLSISEQMNLNTTRGVLVVEVTKGSPADKAGIRGSTRSPVNKNQTPLGGDVIITVDNVTVKKIDDIITYSEETKRPGDSVTMTILREGKKIYLNVTLGERPPPNNQQ